MNEENIIKRIRYIARRNNKCRIKIDGDDNIYQIVGWFYDTSRNYGYIVVRENSSRLIMSYSYLKNNYKSMEIYLSKTESRNIKFTLVHYLLDYKMK